MSHLVNVEVELDNMDAVKQALEEMGFQTRHEEHTLGAYGWKMKCDLSVQKKNGSQLMIGFKQQEDGKIRVEADWYGTGLNRGEFTQKLQQLHAKHKVVNVLKKRRWQVGNPTVNADGSISLVASRWE